MEFKVSISNDFTIPLTLGPPLAAMHDYLGPVPPAPMVYVPIGVAAELPLPMFWPPGMMMGANKLSTKTVHKNLAICLGGHDVGVLIGHLQIAPSPSNTMTWVHILFSSRSSLFQSSTVLTDGKGTAACTMFNLPPTPMMTCMDPVSLPTTASPTSLLNTMTFGMSLADYIIGAVAAAATMAVEFALSKLPGGPDPSSLVGAIMGKVGLPKLRDWAVKTAIGVGAGLARMIFTDGPAAVTVGVGSPYLKVEAQVERNADGEWSVSVGSQVGPTTGGVGHNVSTGETEGKVGIGSPRGSDEVSGSSEKGGQSSESTHSVNPGSWGAPL